MVNSEFTHVVVIMDRSGSMMSVKEDMEGGFNQFIEEQQKGSGRCTMSLYQFDDQYEIVYENKDVQDVPAAELAPRGCTALLDAIGRTFNSVGKQLSDMPENERPGRVVVMIITDGYENASSEFKKDQIKGMLEHQQNMYSWEVVFLGANIDAFAEGFSMGICAANCLTYAANSAGTRAAFASVTKNLSDVRCGTKLDMSFTEEDQKAQEDAGA